MDYINTAMIGAGARHTNGRAYNSALSRHTYWLTDSRTRVRAEVTFIVNTEMGNLGTTGLVLHELDRASYQAAFILGIAGTLLPEEFRLGDVVVAAGSKYLGYDKIKGADPTYTPDPRKVLGTSWLRVRRDFVLRSKTEVWVSRYIDSKNGIPPIGLQGVRANLLPVGSTMVNTSPSVHQGVVFGTDWVVDSAEYSTFLLDRDANPGLDTYLSSVRPKDKNRTKWLPARPACLDMETFGFFKALEIAGDENFHGFSVRGISDPCADKEAVQSGARGQIRDIAAVNAAVVFVDLLINLMLSDVGS